MASDVSAMVTQHVNAIVTVSIEQSAAEQGLTQAKAQDIPAVSFCGAITNNGAPLYAGDYAPNDAAISATVTRYMIDDLGGKGNVVAQFYSPINALARRDAVAVAMLNQAGMKVVASHQVNFTNSVQDTHAVDPGDVAGQSRRRRRCSWTRTSSSRRPCRRSRTPGSPRQGVRHVRRRPGVPVAASGRPGGGDRRVESGGERLDGRRSAPEVLRQQEANRSVGGTTIRIR